MDQQQHNTEAGPGCAHSGCVFERDCLIVQAAAEYLDAWAARLDRRAKAHALAVALGLTEREEPLLDVAFYGRTLSARKRAGKLLAVALARIAGMAAAA